MQNEKDTSHYQKCQMMMRKIEKHNNIRMISAGIMLFLNITLGITPLAMEYGLLFVIFALLYTAGIFISFLFSVPETPKVCTISAVLILMGLISGWIFIPFCAYLLALLLWVIPDYKKLEWLKTQEGYPQFSERFDQQMRNFGKEYQPDYMIKPVYEAEMPDVSRETPVQEFASTSESIAMPDIPEPLKGEFYAN